MDPGRSEHAQATTVQPQNGPGQNQQADVATVPAPQPQAAPPVTAELTEVRQVQHQQPQADPPDPMPEVGLILLPCTNADAAEQAAATSVE